MELGVLGSTQSLHVAPSTESTCLLGEWCVRAPVRSSERIAFWYDDGDDDDDAAADDVCFSAAYANSNGRRLWRGRKGMGGKSEEPLPHPFPCDRVFFPCILNTTCDVLGAEGGSDAGTV